MHLRISTHPKSCFFVLARSQFSRVSPARRHIKQHNNIAGRIACLRAAKKVFSPPKACIVCVFNLPHPRSTHHQQTLEGGQKAAGARNEMAKKAERERERPRLKSGGRAFHVALYLSVCVARSRERKEVKCERERELEEAERDLQVMPYFWMEELKSYKKFNLILQYMTLAILIPWTAGGFLEDPYQGKNLWAETCSLAPIPEFK